MTLAVGVIGAGVMGAEHARLLHDETPGADVAAVSDADGPRATAAARGAATFADPMALIRSDAVQAVVVASPDATHAALAKACIAAGKPVLCEKPLAGMAAEALDVVAAESRAGQRLVPVGYMRRFDPGYGEMKRARDRGGIGEAVLLHNVHRCRDLGAPLPRGLPAADGGPGPVGGDRPSGRGLGLGWLCGNGHRRTDRGDPDKPQRNRADPRSAPRLLHLNMPLERGRPMPIRFSLNHTCAPQLSLPRFITLAVGAGVTAVEIRNDIEGREFADGTPAAELRAQLDAAGLAVASVNALQRFNDWSPAREAEARALVAYTAALGAPGLVLCPRHDEGNGWTEAEAERNLREGLRRLRPILRDHDVTGYVEPLGMRGSTMKRQDMAVAAVTDIDGWDAYQLCYDTFQFFRCGDTQLFPQHVGLAHMSGISRTDLGPGDLTEPDRGLIFVDDRVGNVAQLRKLAEAGYGGFVSMEPFSPAVQTDPSLQGHLRASLEYVAALISATRART